MPFESRNISSFWRNFHQSTINYWSVNTGLSNINNSGCIRNNRPLDNLFLHSSNHSRQKHEVDKSGDVLCNDFNDSGMSVSVSYFILVDGIPHDDSLSCTIWGQFKRLFSRADQIFSIHCWSNLDAENHVHACWKLSFIQES